MPKQSPPVPSASPDEAEFALGSPWSMAALVAWGLALLVVLTRTSLHPGRPTALSIYLTGGSAWAASQPLYTDWRGFVYSPASAWFFSVLAWGQLGPAVVIWRLLTGGTLLLGLGALLDSGVFHRIPPARRGLVFLALLPLSIGNLDNGQANPLIAGLLMMAVAAAQGEAWTLCAIAAAIATAIKIYPVALALLFCVLRPREFTWRFAIALLVLALLPFAVKDPHYVAGQYHDWLRTRLADDRTLYPMKDAPLDLWYLLVRLGKLPINPHVYTALQLIAGAALAVFTWLQHRRMQFADLLAALFLLVSVWMLLLGPATENQTYVVLAPAACLLAVETWSHPASAAARSLALTAFVMLLAATARNSLFSHLKSPWYMAIQPVAALVLLAAILAAGFPKPATGWSPR